MKEHPIIFSGKMVQAILKGRKVQTRRVMKPQPWLCDKFIVPMWVWRKKDGPFDSLEALCRECPYGGPGDLLWVQETWGYVEGQPEIYYRADTEQMIGQQWGGFLVERWRPSIHMRRRDSRITLEVVSVRVERVQDISEADAYAEGIGLDPTLPHPIQWFRELWDTINAKRGGKKWLVEPWDLWLWGHDEHDDPESIALDVMDPGAIQWRNPEELGPDYKFRFFRDNQPPSDGYYEVIWEKGDLVEYVYLRRADPIEGDDYVKYDYSWSSNPWVWVVEFRQI